MPGKTMKCQFTFLCRMDITLLCSMYKGVRRSCPLNKGVV